MESVNHVEPLVEIKHKQTQTTNGVDSHSKCPRLDSGNESADMDDGDILENGEMGREHLQNCFSSRSASCNGVGEKKLPDKSSSSNCLGSLSGLQPSGKKIERQNHVDLPLSQDHVDLPLSQDHVDLPLSQDRVGLPLSQDKVDLPLSQDHVDLPLSQDKVDLPLSQDCVGLPLSQDHVGLHLLQDRVGLPLSQEHVGLPLSQDHVGLPLSQDHIDLPLSQDKVDLPLSQDKVDLPLSQDHVGLPLSRDHVGLPPSQVHVDLPLSQVHVGLPLSQDHIDLPLSQDHGGLPLSQDRVIPLCGNSSSVNQDGNLSPHLTGTLKSAAAGINSHEDIPETNQDNINHSYLAVEENDSVRRLAHQLPSRASSELQNNCCGGGEISAAGLHHDNITRCLSAPISSTKMPYHPLQFMSLPASPIDLVPKHVMDNLERELSRERYRVKRLYFENDQLHVKITELEGRHQYFAHHYTTNISLCVERLKLQEQNISFLKNSADTWRGKYNEKDKELSTANQTLRAYGERCQQLEVQICILQEELREEKHKNKILNDSFCNLERTLKKERARFERDDKCLKEKIGQLKQANKYMREGLHEHTNCPMFVEEYEPLPETDLGITLSDQTQPKCVYPENTVSQAQETFPKEKLKKSSDYKTHHTSHKLECTKSATREATPPHGKICSHCYKESSEFNSYEEFMDHIGKCER